MSKILDKLSHEPVAFWTGLLTVLVATLTAYGVFPELAGVLTAVITVLGGTAVRQTVTPTVATSDDTNPQMGAP